MAGLHDMAPIVPTRWVMRTVFAPIRAAAAAASQPACPPPITATSNRYTIKTSGGAFSEGAGRGQNRGFIENVSRETLRLTGLWRKLRAFICQQIHQNLADPRVIHERSLPNTEIPENHVENVVNIDATGEARQGMC